MPSFPPFAPLGMHIHRTWPMFRLALPLLAAAIMAGCCTPCASPCGGDACAGSGCGPTGCASCAPLFSGRWFLAGCGCGLCRGSQCDTECDECHGCGACGCGGLFGKRSSCGPNCYDPATDSSRVRRIAKSQARKSMTRLWWQTKSRPSCDFREGYTQAYVDIAEGGTGVVPAVPPERYWKSKNRSAEGYARAEEWFAGYRTGASAAEAEGLSQYNTIPTSSAHYGGDQTGMTTAGEYSGVIR